MINFSNEEDLYESRSKFLESLVIRKVQGDRLIKKTAIREDLFLLLRYSCYVYIVSCLNHNKFTYEVSNNFDEFILKNAAKITQMANVTPNGVIRPKFETFAEFNLIQKYLNLILNDLGIFHKVQKIRAPISIRVVTSQDDPSILERPRANNRLHSDFWTGAVCDFAVLIPIFGSLDTIDVVFCEPQGVSANYLKEYPNYADGVKTFDSYKEYKTVMEIGNLYLQDIFCLHGTRRRGVGARVSIDFTFQSNDYESTIKPYYSSKAIQSDNHLDVSTWKKIGYENMFFDSEKIEDAENNPSYTLTSLEAKMGSAIKLQTSKTAKMINLNTAEEIINFESNNAV